jgi:hypothetical protein
LGWDFFFYNNKKQFKSLGYQESEGFTENPGSAPTTGYQEKQHINHIYQDLPTWKPVQTMKADH